MAVVRIGVLGGGISSAVGRAHQSALSLVPGARVCSGAFSRDDQRNRESALAWGIDECKVRSSLEDLLDDGDLDAVLILTPTDQHARQVLLAASTRIAVICEKALSNELSSALEISNAFASRWGQVSVIFNYTGFPMIRELRQMIAAGHLGRIHRIELRMPQEGFIKRDLSNNALAPQAWRLSDAHIPTVSLDLGVHLHSLAHVLVGSTPRRVCAAYRTDGNFPGIVDSVDAIVEHDDLVAVYSFGKTSLGTRNGLAVSVFGDAGSASWSQEHPDEMIVADGFGRRFVVDRGSPGLLEAGKSRYERFKAGHPTGFVEALANYYVDVIDQITSRRASSAVLGLPAAIEGLSLMDAMTRSSEDRAWIEIGTGQ